MGKTSQPALIKVEARPYVFTRVAARPDQLTTVIPDELGRGANWLATQTGIVVDIAIVRYRRISATNTYMDIGYIIDRPIPDQGDIVCDTLPAGDYVGVIHMGPYEEIGLAHAVLHQWAQTDSRHLNWDMTESPEGQDWNALVELYITDPASESNSSQWQSQVIARLKD